MIRRHGALAGPPRLNPADAPTMRRVLRAVPLLALACAVRVRREIRSLPEAERAAVFAALTVMKNTSQADGEARFGPDFVNYEAFVVKHAHCATHPRCDQGHYGPAFATYHRAFNLLMERSLLSVDPGIEALPYWDYNLDLERYADPRDSEVWTASYFGENEGDPADGYMIRDGPFAAWRVHADARARARARQRVQHAARADEPAGRAAPTRASSICGVPTPTTFSLANWTTCLATPQTFDDFFDCIDAGARVLHTRNLFPLFIARSRIKLSISTPPPAPAPPPPAKAWAACTVRAPLARRCVGRGRRQLRREAGRAEHRRHARAAWSARPTATRRTRRAPRRACARATTPRARARATRACASATRAATGTRGTRTRVRAVRRRVRRRRARRERRLLGRLHEPERPGLLVPPSERRPALHGVAVAARERERTPLPHRASRPLGTVRYTLGDVIADTDPFVGALLGREGSPRASRSPTPTCSPRPRRSAPHCTPTTRSSASASRRCP